MEELERAKELALRAGEKILEIYESGEFNVTEKGDKGPLTKADLAANEIIVSGLRSEFPDDGLLTEEERDNKKRLRKERVWIIDPLDGTKEFIFKNGEFTVNIGLVESGKPVLGVVYAPAKGELYYAAKGRGAYYEKGGEKKEIRVSDNKEFSEMVMTCSRSHSGEKEESLKRLFKDCIPSGSSLKGCRIAKGEADVYFRFGPVNEWDICAMNCVLNEAGGMLTNLEGKEIAYNRERTLLDGFLASNGKNHGGLLDLI
jgi:3'(2'), 5'-bisphosphate nucleotidase